MNLRIHFYLLNEDFSQEHADANFGGQESENNQKFEWEDEFEVKDLKNIELSRKATFNIQGYLPTDELFDVPLTNMFAVKLTTQNNEMAYMGVSESILDSFEEQKEGPTTTLHVYIKDYEPHGELMPGVYVASKEFPKELVF